MDMKEKIEYKIATENNIDEIFCLVKNAIDTMEEKGIHQWDEVYPTKEDFLADIKNRDLYAGIVDGKIAVVYAANKCQYEDYFTAKWTYDGDDFCVIHRLCVNPDFQNQGIARITLEHIEDEQKNNGIKSMRLDVFTENPYALRLYEKAGYHKIATADWRKGKFLLMEKAL